MLYSAWPRPLSIQPCAGRIRAMGGRWFKYFFRYSYPYEPGEVTRGGILAIQPGLKLLLVSLPEVFSQVGPEEPNGAVVFVGGYHHFHGSSPLGFCVAG